MSEMCHIDYNLWGRKINNSFRANNIVRSCALQMDLWTIYELSISNLSCTRFLQSQNFQDTKTVHGLSLGIHQNLCWPLAQAINQFACIPTRLILTTNSDSFWLLPSRLVTPNPSGQFLGLHLARRSLLVLLIPALPFGRRMRNLESGNAWQPSRDTKQSARG